MKKIVKLNESMIQKLVMRVLQEQENERIQTHIQKMDSTNVH